MDDDILNNPNIVRGDVLGSNVDQELLAFNVSKIQQSSESIDKHMESIDKELLALTKDLKDMNKDNFRSSAQDRADKKSSKSDNDSSFKSSTKKKKNDFGNAGDFMDGIEEGIYEALGLPNLSKSFENMKDNFLSAFAQSVGVPAEDAIKEIGKSVVVGGVDSIRSKSTFIDNAFAKYSNNMRDWMTTTQEDGVNAVYEAVNQIDDIDTRQKFEHTFSTFFENMFDPNFEMPDFYGEAEKEAAKSGSKNGGPNGLPDLSAVGVQWDPLFDYLDSRFDMFEGFDFQELVDGGEIPEELDVSKDEIQNLIDTFEDEYKNNPQAYSKKEKSSLTDLKNQFKEGNYENLSKDMINKVKQGDIKGALNGVMGKGGKAGTAAKTAGNAAKAGKTAATTAKTAKSTVQATKAMSTLAKTGLNAAKGLLRTNAAGIAVAVGLTVLEKAAGPMIASVMNAFDKLNKLGEKADEVANRYGKSQEARMKEQQERIKKDVETYIKTPFKIMEDSAKRVYDAWEQTIGIINQTQGYDKAGLQDLMTAYAERLKSEGLESAVGTTDVTNMLKTILDSGLSGAAAEEFAYISTVLKAAFPTQDFTSYAQSYGSMVSQYISQGYAQTEAIQKASQELQTFVNNTMSASRAAGGLETNLSDSAKLFSDVNKIAQNVGKTDTSKLSAALATVQGVTGQYEGVGTSIVDRIVEAALNGNDQSLVALRSLAGTGAANTAFLRALYDNPNSVLSKMFTNLGTMIDKQSDNYMEVAHSLSDTFGISANALVQIDWNKVANSLSNNSAANALNENMKLLKSGESTYSAEAQRMQQINEMMIDQGLAYVLDNEAAREIQQHMWDQEIAEEMQEATYGVELQGAALEALTAIKDAVAAIIKFLTNPLGAIIGGVMENFKANEEADALHADLRELIELGKVGNGNTRAFHDLTTYDVKQLTKPANLTELWGGSSSYYSAKAKNDAWREKTNSLEGVLAGGGTIFGQLGIGANSAALDELGAALAGQRNRFSGGSGSAVTSRYSWGAGKSSSRLLSSLSPLDVAIPTNMGVASSEEANASIQNKVVDNLNSWVETMGDAVKDGKSFEEWYSTASNFGIQDAEAALKDNNKTKSDLEGEFNSKSTDEAVENQKERNAKEEQFWEEGQIFWKETFPTDFEQWCVTYDERMTQWEETFVAKADDMKAFLDQKYLEFITFYMDQASLMLKATQSISDNFNNHFVDDFLKEWKDYYIGNHTAYYDSIGKSATELAKTTNRERNSTGESVLALAKAITESGSEFADPQLQTNALLSQILIVLEAIMQASNSSGGGFTLSTALSGLGLGGAIDTAVGALTNPLGAAVNAASNAANNAKNIMST